MLFFWLYESIYLTLQLKHKRMKNYDDLIGAPVSWTVGQNEMHGLFLQIVDNQAEVVCFKMGDNNCHLKVFVNLELLKFSNL